MLFRSTRESYADNAVGYVQLKRTGNHCEVKGRMTPEHNIRKKAYGVSLTCDESTQTLHTVACDGCAAHLGGCKHAVAFLFWVHRQCSLPSTTETQCYWKKSSLSSVGTAKRILYAQQIGKKNPQILPPKDPETLKEFMDICKEQKIYNLQISGSFYTNVLKEHLSLHILKLKFLTQSSNNHTPEQFLNFVENQMTNELCKKAEVASVEQNSNAEWYELRYGRITASKIHDVSRCQTLDGSLVESILGAKFKLTEPIKRGMALEKEVLKLVSRQHKVVISPSGFIMNPIYPFAGASPDGINKDFVLEIKCPSKDSTMAKYICNGKPADRYYAQIQMQMLFAKKERGLFCVAHPDFESTKLTTQVWVNFDPQFCIELISKSKEFWISAIYPRL